MTKEELLQIISSNITDNDNGLITAQVMRDVLGNIVNESYNQGYTYIGIATPSTTPMKITAEDKVFYIAVEAGDYTGFGQNGITELTVIKSEEGRWVKEGLRTSFQNVIPSPGRNLVDKNKLTLGKAIGQSGAVTTNADLALSDFIPVNGKDLVHNGYITLYWPMAVYDDSKILLRTITSSPYIYQEGDAYVRFNFFNTKDTPMANYGNKLLPYEPYNPIGGYLTDIYDAINNIEIDDSDFVKSNTVNLINPDDPDFLEDYGIGSASNGNGALIPNSTMSVTGYIPVDKQNIAHNTYITNFWCGAVYNINKEQVALLTNQQYTYDESRGDYYIRLTVLNASISTSMANYGTTLLPYEPYNPMGGYLTDVKEDIKELQGEEYTFKKAIGSLTSNHSYIGEMETNPIDIKPYVSNVGREESTKQQANIDDLNIVAVNHDDMNQPDLYDTRIIYNKYGYNANFSYILNPFNDASMKKNYMSQIKEMLRDGHSIGFHAPFTKSYWMFNRLFDIRPDSTFTFAPTREEIISRVGSSANISSYYFTIPSSVTTGTVGSLTDAQFAEITRCFTIYGDSYYLITGLDLNDVSVQKTPIQWLEYWYNELIDNTLGYSSESTDIATKYADDYEYLGGSYPDAAHLISGKIVFGDDTSNANYTNAEYQKVGRFKKGLFKGCATSCNYEVIDRILTIAEAVFKHYYGDVQFSAYNMHGMGYAVIDFVGDNGLHYLDRGENVLAQINAPLPYSSLVQSSQSVADIFLKHGIRMTNQDSPRPVILESQIGLFFGQKDVRGGDWNFANKYSGSVSYLSFFGLNQDDVTGGSITESDFNLFLKNQDFWLKFAYENAGKSVTRNGLTFYVQPNIKDFIQKVLATKGTGKIPFFTYDTNVMSLTMSSAVSLICQYCYDTNYRIVNVEEARQIANSRTLVRTNYIPNPLFRQSLLIYFDGQSSSVDAYMPDGLYSEGEWSSIDVSEETVNDKSSKVLTLSANTSSYAQYKIYGLEEGDYRLTLDVKGSNSEVEFFIKKNNDYLEQNYGGVERFTPFYRTSASDTWQSLTYEFSIKGNSIVTPVNDLEIISDGYGDNVSNVVLKFKVNSGGSISIANPKIVIE